MRPSGEMTLRIDGGALGRDPVVMSLRLVFVVFVISAAASPALAQDGTGSDPADPNATPTADEAPAPTAEGQSDVEPDPQPASTTTSTPQPAPAPAPQPAPQPQPQPQQQAQPQAQPAPVIHPSAQSSTPPPPAREEEEDDGRDADFLWIEAGFGYSWANLAAFKSQNFIPGVEQLKGSGYAGHVAAGFKLFLFTLGARGTVGSYPAADNPFDIWSLMFDLGLRIPILFMEPYFRAGIGYAWMGQVNVNSLMDSSVSVYGLTIEAGAGLDIYLNPYISIGGGVDVAFLNLTRQRLDMCTSSGGAMCNIGGVDLQENGDAVGFQLRATGHLALHF